MPAEEEETDDPLGGTLEERIEALEKHIACILSLARECEDPNTLAFYQRRIQEARRQITELQRQQEGGD